MLLILIFGFSMVAGQISYNSGGYGGNTGYGGSGYSGNSYGGNGYSGNRYSGDGSSRFQITNYDNVRGSRNNRNPDDATFMISNNGRRDDTSNGRFQDSSRGFPDFVRIEVEVQRLDNPQGLLSSGKKCDNTKSCDTRLSAFLDLDNPLTPFPGRVPVSKWTTIYNGKNTNSPVIGKVMTADLCGGSTSNVNLRARAVDVDVLSANDEINTFDCLFPLNSRLIDTDALNARWSSPKQCTSGSSRGPARLFARQRAYQIPSTSCRSAARG